MKQLFRVFLMLPALLSVARAEVAAYVFGIRGGVSVQQGRGPAVPVYAGMELVQGDVLVLGKNSVLMLTLLDTDADYTLFGPGKAKLSLRSVIGTIRRTVHTVPKRREIDPPSGEGGLVVFRTGDVIRILSPNGGQWIRPAEVRWSELKVKEVDPSNLPSITVVVADEEGNRLIDEELPIDRTSLPLPDTVPNGNGRYQVAVRAHGPGVGDQMTTSWFRVLTEAQSRAFKASEIEAFAANKPPALLHLACLYAVWRMDADADRMFRAALERFPNDGAVLQSYRTWKKARRMQ